MDYNNFYKEKSERNIDSDYVVLKDSNDNILKAYWFVHEVMLETRGNSDFVFLKSDNPTLYKFLSKLGETIKSANKGDFVKDNKFTWHHMSRAWDRPFEEEAGFVASLLKDRVEIKFFPAKDKAYMQLSNNYLISMGGANGYEEPYQSISNVFARTLNMLLYELPYREEKEIENLYYI